MDHLTAYNVNSDDGVSWVDGAPTRSILISWKQTMPKLAAILYEAGKHIFANTIVRRLDANEFVDGIYDEFADFPRMLNLAALLGVRKPTIGWTRDINTLRPDPDALFQQHLHLGVFPTVPFPGADHTISPDAWADQYYLDYGPLFAAIRGKRWVLEPHVVSVENRAASVNIFEVPGGYAVPITFADGKEIGLTIRRVPRESETLTSISALHPGEEKPVNLSGQSTRKELKLHVPTKRGCALLCLECKKS